MSRDWSKIRCTKCKYHHKCRKKSVAKGSKMCLEQLGMYTPPENMPKQVSEDQKKLAILWNILGRNKKR